MKKLLWILFIGITLTNLSFTSYSQTQVVAGRMNEVFLKTDLATTLHDPWEITYGPDDSLWVTESKSYTLFKIAPTGGAKRIILNLATYPTNAYRRQFGRSGNPAGWTWPQGGLMGMALHPHLKDSPYVFLSFVYSFTGQQADSMGCIFVNKLVRFTYDSVTNQLGNPVVICDTLPGSSDHNSGRMIIAPYNGKNYLFYAQGDMGAGQFGNKYRINKAQNQNSYEGKILRFNIDPDPAEGTYDQWIPNDNPYNTGPVASPTTQSAVWAIGIRNNQGFAYGKFNGKDYLYGASHGPYSDDEVNVIDSLKNYGHPYVIGYAADRNYDSARAGAPPRTSPALSVGASTLPYIVNEQANALAFGSRYRDPIFAGYGKQTHHFIDSLYLNNPGNGSWPSEAWSGMDLDTSNIIPGFKNSLVLGSLKWGRIVRLKLNYNLYGGDSIDHSNSDTTSYFQGRNRFRDIALSPDNKYYRKTYFVITDSSNTTSGPSGANPMPVDCMGCLQSYTFLGYQNNGSNKSTIPQSIPITTTTNVNTCVTGTPVIVNANNNTLWVPITGPDGNIVAEIYPNTNNLDTIVTSFYINSGSVRQDSHRRTYLDRNMTITPKNQPAAGKPVNIRLYLTNAEYTSLKNSTNSLGQGSGITAITDLRILKNNDACGGSLTNTATLITPTFAEVFGAGGYMLQGSITSFSSFYITSANMIILPVTLVDFTGSLQNNMAVLNWETANESNIYQYVVERSIDGSNFDRVGAVAAKGNSTENTKYSFTDKDAAAQSATIVYYRLIITEKGGTFSYSKIISVELNPSTFTVFVYPVPISDVLNVRVSLEKADNIQIQIADIQGHVVYSQSKFVSGGTSEIKIDSKAWPSQTYSVKVVSNDNKIVVTKKVIKM